MAETKNTEICETEDETPVYRKQIRKTTYIVKVRFSKSARETMEQKIQRMLRLEMEQGVNNP
jgi:hypothetical protein